MTYYFTEYEFPINDVNVDIDFNSDLTYADLTDDVLDKYNTPYENNNIAPKEPKPKTDIREDKYRYGSNTKIYVCFIICVIIIFAVWFLYSYPKNEKRNNITPKYSSSVPELTMMSPDVGTGFRYYK